MKICDSHLHFGDPKKIKKIVQDSPLKEVFPCYRTVQFEKMDSYERRLEENGVGCSVLIPFVFRELDKKAESMKAIEYAKKYPGKYFPYALLDDDPGFVEEHYKEIVGLKQHIVMHETALSDVRREIFSSLQDHGLILLLHTHSDKRLEYVSHLAKEFPNLKIQVAHMGRALPGDIRFIYDMIDALRPFENVFFDTSTVRQPEVVTWAANVIGAERILFGSDFPFFMDKDGTEDVIREQIKHIEQADLSDRERELIFCKNFERLVTFGK